MKELDLSDNQLTSLPESIGDLAQLKELDLGNNQLTSLPERIGDLAQLKELYLDNNQLTSLPERIGDLAQLKELDLSDNQLTSLPERIGDLAQLEELDLSNNQLTSLPERIGDLTQLNRLDLSNNQLTSLPRSIERLANITVLDLRDNPLVEYGEGDALGWRELRNTFGDRVVLSQDSLRGPDRVITEQEVYQRLRAEPLHWNTDKLASIVLDPVTQHTLSGEEILHIWTSALAKYQTEHETETTEETWRATSRQCTASTQMHSGDGRCIPSLCQAQRTSSRQCS